MLNFRNDGNNINADNSFSFLSPNTSYECLAFLEWLHPVSVFVAQMCVLRLILPTVVWSSVFIARLWLRAMPGWGDDGAPSSLSLLYYSRELHFLRPICFSGQVPDLAAAGRSLGPVARQPSPGELAWDNHAPAVAVTGMLHTSLHPPAVLLDGNVFELSCIAV